MSNYSSSQYQPNVIWTVAGSDSCAGAGLQTDLHTFHDFNLVGCSVVTSVTAQHPHGVLCVTPVVKNHKNKEKKNNRNLAEFFGNK